MRKLITSHLSIAETACHCGCGLGSLYPYLIDPYIAFIFETLRIACGNNPLVINCGWRCPKHNKKVGGYPNSVHLTGGALDIQKPEWMEITEFHNIADLVVGDGGVGRYPNFVHIDAGGIIDSLPKRRRWAKL